MMDEGRVGLGVTYPDNTCRGGISVGTGGFCRRDIDRGGIVCCVWCKMTYVLPMTEGREEVERGCRDEEGRIFAGEERKV